MRIWIFILFAFFTKIGTSQFAPAAGKVNSTAIKYDSACFVNWAVGSELQRGFKQINKPDSGYTTVGDETSCLGKALTNGVVSLGDGGAVILEFNPPIADGPGFDFAVFENSFSDTFLELAFVEISNDKIHWTKFPSTSLTQTQKQTPSFGFTYPEKINNLAGKYRSPYGTPFDLSELADSQFYSSEISYLRITDVVGSIDSTIGKKDHQGHLINDPFPTLFASGGFDLDAVGVINQSSRMSINSFNSKLSIYPNPAKNSITTSINSGKYFIYSLEGKLITQGGFQQSQIPFNLDSGFYLLEIHSGNNYSRTYFQVSE